MSEVEFLGARLEKDIIKMVEETAKEEHVDKTKALKDLILLGRKQFLINKYLGMYKNGLCSIDKAAEECNLTINEMMKEAAKQGLKSTETIEEYKQRLKLLLK